MKQKTFDLGHYVPILKWKRAELRALQGLEQRDRERMTPLIELVMPKPSSPYSDKVKKVRKTDDEIFSEIVSKFKTQRVKEIPNEIKTAWGDTPIFVDFSLLYEREATVQLKINSMKQIIAAGDDLNLCLIPVVNLGDDNEIKRAAVGLSKQGGRGLCLRIALSDMSDMNKLNRRLGAFLRVSGLLEEGVDLLVDLKSMTPVTNQYAHWLRMSQDLMGLKKWRNLIFAAGSFPEDLSACKFDEATFLPRLEWQSWHSYARDKKLTRTPTFSDYAVRNPVFSEPTQFYPPTTSIRYTQEEAWMVMKGKRLDFKLYLVNAKLLVGSSQYFYGKRFSAGDDFLSKKAAHYDVYIKNPKVKGTGGSEDWLFMGLNHHLVLAARQIAKLS